jgi:cellulose synthase operon protein C
MRCSNVYAGTCALAVAAWTCSCFCSILVVASAAPARAQDSARMQVKLAPLTAAVEKGRYSEAEAGLRLALPRNDGARAWLVRVLFETGRYDEARALAAQWSELTSLTGKRSYALAWVAEAWLAQGELEHAEAVLRSALAQEPTALRAQWLLGRLLWDRGRREDALRELEAVMARSSDADTANAEAASARQRAQVLRYRALAASTLGRVNEANDAFRVAVELDPARSQTLLDWAQLSVEKYDLQAASERVQRVLNDNPQNARALLLLARLSFMSAGDTVAAQTAVTQALVVNPKLTGAYVLRAEIALREADVPTTHALLDRALQLNPTDLEALSVRAAACFLDDDTREFAQLEQRVLALYPHASRFYALVAEFAEWEHRYAEATELLKRALHLDPEDSAARASLGLGLLRMGDERAGLAALQRAWERDHFNVQVYNTLRLYEGGIRRDYSDFTAGRFQLRLHKTERPVLEPYLVPLLDDAFAQMRARWNFTPEGPLRVELYADRTQFSVRTTGMPNADVQGVSFGKVITGLSPRGGPFNWGQIVWHELSHVFHLQLSKSHVPRWFTEGLAEYETALARPEWKREDDYVLWQTLQAGRLPPMAAMNRAFTEAHSPDELMASYFCAYRAVEYIVTRFGFASVRKLLVAFGEGKKLEAAVPLAFGLPLSVLDHDYREALTARLSRYEHEVAPNDASYVDAASAALQVARAPGNPDLLAALSLAELQAGHMEAAAQAARSSLKLAPEHRLAHFARARVALAQGDLSTAERSLAGIVRSGADGYLLRMLLARGLLERGQLQAALAQAQAAERFDPERVEAHRFLLELAPKLGDEALAERALSALCALDQHDAAIHKTRLALLVRNKAWDEAIREGESTLYIAPEDPAVHLHLGVGYVERGAYDRGLVELERALTLGYPQPGLVRLLRARVLLKQNKREAAVRELQLALSTDPSLDIRARDMLAPL